MAAPTTSVFDTRCGQSSRIRPGELELFSIEQKTVPIGRAIGNALRFLHEQAVGFRSDRGEYVSEKDRPGRDRVADRGHLDYRSRMCVAIVLYSDDSVTAVPAQPVLVERELAVDTVPSAQFDVATQLGVVAERSTDERLGGRAPELGRLSGRRRAIGFVRVVDARPGH